MHSLDANNRKIRRAPIPRDSTPSPFVVSCLQGLPRKKLGFAGDLGCGYGRHARLLAAMGYTVLALDVDYAVLTTLVAPARQRRKRPARGTVYAVAANVDSCL